VSENDPSPPSSAPPGTAPTEPKEWRAGDNAPSWAKGKSPEEILGIAQQLYSFAETAVRQPTPVQPPPQRDWGQLRDDDYVDGATLRGAAQALNQQVGQGMQGLYQMQAESNLAQIKRDHRDAFSKWGPEIQVKLNQLPFHMWTPGNLDQVVRLVKADHIDDLATERARELVSQMDPTLRPTGSTGDLSGYQRQSTRLTESKELPADYRDLLKQKGIDENTLDEFCRATGQTRQQWFEMAKKHSTNFITDRSTRLNGVTSQAPAR